VNPIVAAPNDAVRRALVSVTEGARFGVEAVAEGAATLTALLRIAPDAWVVTGGTLTLATPFLKAARTAKSPVVAVLSGRVGPQDRSGLRYGGLAVLRSLPASKTFQAAATASRAGLNVWDPGLSFAAGAEESIEAPLSPRERAVVELTGTGLSTKAVARQLGISPNTVKFHLRAAFEKLGATSRAEAVLVALHRGELSV
jgi:DNA-binding CsgD family transcriptional regulator